MSKKPKTQRVTAAQRLEALRQRVADLEAMNRQLHARNNELSDDLREAQKRTHGLQRDLNDQRPELVELTKRVARLEGYRDRVERVDALERGLPVPGRASDCAVGSVPPPDIVAGYARR